MKLSRRSIFGQAAGAAVAPIVSALPAAARPLLVINMVPNFREHQQNMLNYWRSTIAEVMPLQPRAPWLAPEDEE